MRIHVPTALALALGLISLTSFAQARDRYRQDQPEGYCPPAESYPYWQQGQEYVGGAGAGVMASDGDGGIAPSQPAISGDMGGAMPAPAAAAGGGGGSASMFSGVSTGSDYSDLAMSGGGNATPFMGRLDVDNRLNLFDSMTAEVRTAVWTTFQYAKDYDPFQQNNHQFEFFREVSPGVFEDVYSPVVQNHERPDELAYRAGVELAVTQNFSILYQQQYSVGIDSRSFGDDWGNPQAAGKFVVFRDDNEVTSVVAGATLDNNSTPGDSAEDATKIYVGLLHYEALTDRLFMQCGSQFGMPISGIEKVWHLDWVVGGGVWLYRQEGLYMGAGTFDPCCSGAVARALYNDFGISIVGVTWQTEFLGKHVVNDTNQGFGETNHMVDFTTGLGVYTSGTSGVNVGYSNPLMDGEVRRQEFILSIWKSF